jgi:Intracellular proteinase inhibitor
MLNYSAMNSLRGLIFALLVLPLPGLAQGVRMSADFLPLEVGKRWTYDVTNQAGQAVDQIVFAVEEHTIVAGISYYVLTDFPFTNETAEPIRIVRYDRTERYFVRKLRNDEGPLFLDDGAITEVLESDASGAPQKFVLRMDKMTLTFQRGVGIVEAKVERPNGVLTAKLIGSANKQPSAPPPPAISGTPISKDPVVTLPLPVAPVRREPVVATVTSQNPRVDVGIVPSPEGYRFVMVVTNVADKLLPFQFRSSQTYDFVIHDASNKEIWRWSNGNFFSQLMRSDSIRAGGKWQFEVVWNRKDNDDNPVPPGQYRLTGIITSVPAVQAVPVALDLQ